MACPLTIDRTEKAAPVPHQVNSPNLTEQTVFLTAREGPQGRDI